MPDKFFVKPKKPKKASGDDPKTSTAKSTKPSNQGRSTKIIKASETNGRTSSSHKQAPSTFNSITNRTLASSSKRRRTEQDIDSNLGSDDEPFARDEALTSDSDNDRLETAQQKRIRLARAYLDDLSRKSQAHNADVSALEIERQHVERRLRRDVAQSRGQTYRFLAASIQDAKMSTERVCLSSAKHFRLSVTAVCMDGLGRYVFAASKDGSIGMYDVTDGSRLHLFGRKGKDDKTGHQGDVLCLAASFDGQYLVSGGKDKTIGVWDIEKREWVTSLGGFRQAVSGLAFRQGSLTLYASSYDRSVRVYDLHAMGFVEALFGHTEPIMDVSALKSEIAVTAGGSDCTLRWWKILDSTQLVFRAGTKSRAINVAEGEDIDPEFQTEGKVYLEGSVDCVTMLNDTHFVSGGDTGSLCLWHVSKKKPVYTRPLAHGTEMFTSSTEGEMEHPRGIQCLACVPYSNLFASGSSDGFIRVWSVDPSAKRFTFVSAIPALGFVNGIQIADVAGFDIKKWQHRKMESRMAKGQKVNGHSRQDGQTLNGSNHSVVASNGKQVQNSEETSDIVLIAALGREPRLGRWRVLHGTESSGERLLICHLISRSERLEEEESSIA